ncbi:hypothetical protein OU426_04475 [Frigidibacter sp. RF13]|uniref:hypothetical protein n=1 Tax=Frigidibacter sp. RF13 TaxID=2997340 RepID=UPI002270F27B|nr:hypothetical protein [Frigidibacter sp. RF13]MCY1126101.1 hypothetical protein [Frigidibacter sp. RF13]
MDKGAAAAASREPDDSAATAEVLLRSETFQQRMERARRERERVLRQAPPEADRPDNSAEPSKPWDRQDRMLGTPPPEKPIGATRRLGLDAQPAASAPLFVRSEAAAQDLPGHVQLAAHAPQQARPRRIGFRIALGFALGVTAGVVISRLPLPSLVPVADLAAPADQPPPSAPSKIARPAPKPEPGTLEAPEPNPQTATGSNLGSVRLVGADRAPLLPAQDAGHRIASVALLAAPSSRGERVPTADAAGPSAPASLVSLPMLRVVGGPERTLAIPALPAAAASPAPRTLAPPDTDQAPAADITAAPPQLAPQPKPKPQAAQFAGLAIHLHSADADPTLAEAALATLLEASAPVADSDTVGFKVSASHLRYYHAEDAEAVAALAKLLQMEARDFTSRADPPPQGFVEIWLAGTGVGNSTATPAPTKKKRARTSGPTPAQQAEAEALKQRLILMLQSGG